MSDDAIDELAKLDDESAENYLDENYAYVYGRYHSQGDTVFSMDKGWDVTRYLLKKVDPSENKILHKLDDKHIHSQFVKEIDNILEGIEIENLISQFNIDELRLNRVYRAESGSSDQYIEGHLNCYKQGFKRASEMNHGIVIHFH